MNFNEALDQLNNSEYVTLPEWKGEKYLAFMPGMTSIWQIVVKPVPNAGNWLPLMADYLSLGWELVERFQDQSSEPTPAANPAEDDDQAS